jgi:hypothetical protein
LGTLAVALCLLIASAATRAAVITYEVTSLSGSDWRYDYTVENNGAAPIDEFTIYFDRGLFSNLAVAASPVGWDSIVLEPDFNIPADGLFDSLALVSGLASGASLSGFSVTFTFLGSDTPGSQPFDIVDPVSPPAVLGSGRTLQAPTNDVPEPGTLSLLLMTGLLAAAKRSRRLDH